MKFFDLHCDTLYEIHKKNQEFFENKCHVSLKRADKIENYIGCFAFWMPDKYRGRSAVEFFDSLYEKFKEEKKKNDNLLKIIEDSQSIKNISNNKVGVLLGIEGCSVLNGDLNKIKFLYDLGIRIITLTWNGANEIGDGNAVENPKGITEFGIKAVKEMEKNKIIVDISHASKELFYDVAELSKRPFIATHSNAYSVCKHKRNLTDEQFKIIKEKKGLVGVTFCKDFLNSSKDAKVSDIMKHIEHFLSLGGEKTLGIGSDFDGTDIPDEIKGIQSIEVLYEYLLRHNYNEELVNRIFYGNSYEFFKNML